MSSMIYISSDYPIPERQNPHERSLSIKEALEMGMEVQDSLLKSGIDRNWKCAIQWSDRSICFDIDNGTVEDGDLNDDYAIIPLYAGCITNEDTAKGTIEEWGEVRCCHEPYPYGAPDFPAPHFDLEFWVTLPWILDNKE